MRTRNYKRRNKKQSRNVNRRKLYKGGQPRWPAPSNPTPAVECQFPNFRPLILSQFGGRKTRRHKTRRHKTRRHKTRR